jgi:hypothetical protein
VKPSGEDYTMTELQESASRSLLRKNRRQKKTLRKTSMAMLEEAEVLDHDYDRAVIRGGYEALGGMLRDKRMNPKFKEKALAKSGFIGKVSDHTSKPEKSMRGISSHAGIRIGDHTIKYDFNSSYMMLLPKNSTDRFELVNLSGESIQSYQQHWHPYYSMPMSIRYILSLTGIHGGPDRLKIKSHINKFSPSHFRRDLMPEHVMAGIERVRKSKGNIREYLKFIGFTSDGDNNEIDMIIQNVDKMNLYKDLSAADEYSSVFNMMKSCSTRVIVDILSRTSPSFHALLTSIEDDVSGVVLTHYIGLLGDELNVACTQLGTSGDAQNFIRIPVVSISREV